MLLMLFFGSNLAEITLFACFLTFSHLLQEHVPMLKVSCSPLPPPSKGSKTCAFNHNDMIQFLQINVHFKTKIPPHKLHILFLCKV